MIPYGLSGCRARRIVAFCALVSMNAGCGLHERAGACGSVAKALTLPQAKKRRTSQAQDLRAAALRFQEAEQRLTGLKTLPSELGTIAAGARQELGIAAKALESAAQARKAGQAADYAVSRLRIEAAERALSDLAQRFAKVCAN